MELTLALATAKQKQAAADLHRQCEPKERADFADQECGVRRSVVGGRGETGDCSCDCRGSQRQREAGGACFEAICADQRRLAELLPPSILIASLLVVLLTLFGLARLVRLILLRTLMIAVLAGLIELFHFDNARLREVATASE